MSEPTLSLTYRDFQIRVAEYLGVAAYDSDGLAIPPTEAHDLSVVKRACNDGWRRFLNSNPKWHWLTPTFTITFDPDGESGECVDGEAWRYHMPDGFYGHMIGWFTYPHGEGRVKIEQASELRVRELRAASDATGTPAVGAIRRIPIKVGDEAARCWELVVWPTPSSSVVITGAARLYANKLLEDEDRPNCGFVFDEAVLAAMLAEAERTKEDSTGEQEAHWAEALVRAIAIDQQSTPRRLGSYGPGGGDLPLRTYSVDAYIQLDGTTFPTS